MENAEHISRLLKWLPLTLRAMIIVTFVYPWLGYVIGASFLSGIYIPQAFNFFEYYKTGDIFRAGIIPMSPLIMLFVLMTILGTISRFQSLTIKPASFLIKNWLRCLTVYSIAVFILAWFLMAEIADSTSCMDQDPTATLTLKNQDIGLPPATDWLFSYRQNVGIIIAKRAKNFDTRYFPSALSDNEAYNCLTTYDWFVRLLF